MRGKDDDYFWRHSEGEKEKRKKEAEVLDIERKYIKNKGTYIEH